MLLVDGSTRVWTTCLRLLHSSARAGVKRATSRSTHSATAVMRWQSLGGQHCLALEYM